MDFQELVSFLSDDPSDEEIREFFVEHAVEQVLYDYQNEEEIKYEIPDEVDLESEMIAPEEFQIAELKVSQDGGIGVVIDVDAVSKFSCPVSLDVSGRPGVFVEVQAVFRSTQTVLPENHSVSGGVELRTPSELDDAAEKKFLR